MNRQHLAPRYSVTISLLLLSLILAGCGQGDVPGPPSAARPAIDLSVTGQQELPGDALSPDGTWLAQVREGELCVYAIDAPDEERCFLPGNCRVSAQSIQWSPDSERLAFTELHQQYYESDLWVLDVKSGELVNLTDDGVDPCGTEGTQAAGSMDLLPVWSSDGASIAFYRNGDEGLSLYRIAASGGTATELLSGSGVGGSSLLWTTEERIVYAPLTASPDVAGLWILDQSGGVPERLVEADPDMGPPWLMDVSARGDRALITYRLKAVQTFYALPSVSYCALVDLDTGSVEPLKVATGAGDGFFGPTVAAFSPDGSKIVYSYQDAGTGDVRLAVRDLDGGPEKVLQTLDETELFLGPDRLLWAENDTIYLPSAHLLLTLGTR
jgi:Tol biopolymer transport system component